MPVSEREPRWKVLLAFAAIYFIWGSSYLGVHFAIETMPPFLMAGVRFTLAGAILILWSRQRGTSWPTISNWRAAAVSGAFMFLGANGVVVWVSQFVPSGIIAIMNATIPFWMVLIDWLRYGSSRPSALVFIGLALGFSGIVLLISPGDMAGSQAIDPVSAGLLLLGPICWSIGSMYSRRADLPRSPGMTTGMQLAAGGILLTILSLVIGETNGFQLAQVSLKSILAFIYLFVVASIIAFTAYVWLLRVSTPARVSTYAFVNPVIAVFLGATMGSEVLTARALIAASIILAGVLMIILYRAQGEVNWRLRLPTRFRHVEEVP